MCAAAAVRPGPAARPVREPAMTAVRAARPRCCPRPVHGPRTDPPRHPRHRHRSGSHPLDGGPLGVRAPGSSRCCYAFGVGEVPISISGDPPAPASLAAHHPRRRLRLARVGDRAGRARPRGPRRRSARAGRSRDGRGRRRRDRRRRHRAGAAAAGAARGAAPTAGDVRPGAPAVRRPHPRGAPLRRGAADAGRRARHRRRGHRRQRPARAGAAGSAWSPSSSSGRGSTRPARSPWSAGPR